MLQNTMCHRGLIWSITCSDSKVSVQVRLAEQTQRFKDQTFEQLEKLVQIKVLEDFLDAAIKGRKGKLPYNSLPDTASVLEVAP